MVRAPLRSRRSVTAHVLPLVCRGVAHACSHGCLLCRLPPLAILYAFFNDSVHDYLYAAATPAAGAIQVRNAELSPRQSMHMALGASCTLMINC